MKKIILILIFLPLINCAQFNIKNKVKPIQTNGWDIANYDNSYGKNYYAKRMSGDNLITVSAYASVSEIHLFGPAILPIIPEPSPPAYDNTLVIEIVLIPPPEYDYNINDSKLMVKEKVLKPLTTEIYREVDKVMYLIKFDHKEISAQSFKFEILGSKQSLEDISIGFESYLDGSYRLAAPKGLIER